VARRPVFAWRRQQSSTAARAVADYGSRGRACRPGAADAVAREPGPTTAPLVTDPMERVKRGQPITTPPRPAADRRSVARRLPLGAEPESFGPVGPGGRVRLGVGGAGGGGHVRRAPRAGRLGPEQSAAAFGHPAPHR